MLFAKLFLTTTTAVLGVHGPHHHSAHRWHHPLGIWHGFTGRTEFVTRGTLDEIEGQNVVPPMLMDLPEAIVRPPAPIVVLYQQRESAPPPPSDPTGEIFSVDHPDFWTPVPYGPVTVEVRLPLPPGEDVTIEYVDLLLDGQPVDSTRYFVGPQVPLEMLPDGQLEARYIYRLPCMAPGKHIVQSRYKIRSLWSRISEPLHFDVRLPNPPRIVAISDAGQHPTPLGKTGRISITKPEVQLQFAGIHPNDEIVVYLDGKPIGSGIQLAGTDGCCRAIRLQGHITPGIHTLTARTVHSDAACSITSKPSNEVVFHYYDEEVYLLRPETGFKNRSEGEETKRYQIRKQDAWPGHHPSLNTSWQAEGELSLHPQTDLESPYRFASRLEPGRIRTHRTDSNIGAAVVTVAFNAAHPLLTKSQRLLAQATEHRDLVVQTATDIREIADLVTAKSAAAEESAVAAAAQHRASLAARNTAEQMWREATDWANEADKHPVAPAESPINDATTAQETARQALEKAKAAASNAAAHADRAQARAQSAKELATEAARAREVAISASEKATQAVARAKLFLKEVDRQIANANLGAAADALQKVEAEADETEAANNEVTKQHGLITDYRSSAEEDLQHAENAHSSAARENQVAQRAATDAAAARTSAKQAAAAAKAATAGARRTAPRTVEEAALHAQIFAEKAGRFARKAKREAAAATKEANSALNKNAAASTAAIHAWEESARASQAAIDTDAQDPSRAAARASSRHADDAMDAWTAANAAAGAVADVLQEGQLAACEARKQAEIARHLVECADDASAIARQIARGNGKQRFERAKKQAWTAEEAANSAEAALARATEMKDKAAEASRLARQHAAAAESNAELARTSADHAATTLRLKADIAAAWDNAEVRDIERYVARQIEAAQPNASADESDPVAVLHARAAAREARELADAEEAGADARIAIVEAEARINRARNTEAPPSPYYFASAAHFPIREFGMRGEVFDREGAVIHEDMKFSFDRDGNYWLDFTIRTPAVPTTVRLQLLVQPSDGAAWHTITLPPMRFRPEEAGDGTHRGHSIDPAECTVAYNHQCRGRSEILRRFYAQMGEGTTIRRKGTARFGFGFETTRRTAAY